MTTYYVCPKCDFENLLHVELDGYKVLDVTVDNSDSGTACAGCNRELDTDAVYEAASLAAVGG